MENNSLKIGEGLKEIRKARSFSYSFVIFFVRVL